MAAHALIPLDRRFYDIGDADEVEHLDARTRFRVAGEPWSVVLGDPCVVILDEAGSGKTTEFKLRPEALVAEGDGEACASEAWSKLAGADGSVHEKTIIGHGGF